MRSVSIVILFLPVILLAGIGSAPFAHAHADLVKADPGLNAVLKAPPERIRLLFSEEPEAKLSEVTILDSSGKEVQSVKVSVLAQNRTIIVTNVSGLKDGVYTVSWRVVSAVDGHTTSGSFPIAIGNATIIKSIQSNQTLPKTESSSPPVSPMEVVIRWVNLASQTAFLGGVIFWVTIWRPSAKRLVIYSNDTNVANQRVLLRTLALSRVSLFAALLATILYLLIQASNIAIGVSILETLPRILETRLGLVVIARVMMIISLAMIFLVRVKQGFGTERWVAGLVLGAILLLTTSLTSHGAADPLFQPLGMIADWIHLIFVSVWVGGVMCMAVVIPVAFDALKPKEKSLLIATLIPRFSSKAVFSLGLIGLTGLFATLVQIGSFSALFTTVYGNALLIKLVLLSFVVVLGGFNQFYVHPRVVSNLAKLAERVQTLLQVQNRFKLSLKTEALIGAAVILVAGFLTASQPAVQLNEQMLQTLAEPLDQSPSVPPDYAGKSEGITINLRIRPMQVGLNDFEIRLTDEKGSPIQDVKAVNMEFKLIGKDIGEVTTTAEKKGEGIYSNSGYYLGQPGKWKVQVQVRREMAYDAIVSFTVTVPFQDFSSLKVREYEFPIKGANPHALSIGSDASVWFTVPNQGKIGRFDPQTFSFEQFALPGESSLPTGIVVGTSGSVWITDPQNNRIVRFDPASKLFKEYKLPTQDSAPSTITIDESGRIWLVEQLAEKIASFSPDTELFKEYAVPTKDAGLQGIASDDIGIWFTEFRANKIGLLDPSTGEIAEFQPDKFSLNAPTGVLPVSDGIIWITEHGSNTLTKFSHHSGTFERFDIPGETPAPYGLAMDRDGNVWFALHLGNRIGVMQLATEEIHTFPIPTPNSLTQWIAIDPQGNVWFAETGSNKLGAVTKLLPSATPTEQSQVDDGFDRVVALAAVGLVVVTVVSYFGGKRRFKKDEDVLNSILTGSGK